MEPARFVAVVSGDDGPGVQRRTARSGARHEEARIAARWGPGGDFVAQPACNRDSCCLKRDHQRARAARASSTDAPAVARWRRPAAATASSRWASRGPWQEHAAGAAVVEHRCFGGQHAGAAKSGLSWEHPNARGRATANGKRVPLLARHPRHRAVSSSGPSSRRAPGSGFSFVRFPSRLRSHAPPPLLPRGPIHGYFDALRPQVRNPFSPGRGPDWKRPCDGDLVASASDNPAAVACSRRRLWKQKGSGGAVCAVALAAIETRQRVESANRLAPRRSAAPGDTVPKTSGGSGGVVDERLHLRAAAGP